MARSWLVAEMSSLRPLSAAAEPGRAEMAQVAEMAAGMVMEAVVMPATFLAT